MSGVDARLCRDLIATLRLHAGRLPAAPWRWEGGGTIWCPDCAIAFDALPRIARAVAPAVVDLRNNLHAIISQLEAAAVAKDGSK